MLLHFSFQTVGNFSCVTLQLMLKHNISDCMSASNLDHIHQTSYLHAKIGFSYYLIVAFGECLP